MSTGMYRLQISLPPEQMDFLRQRAKRDGMSIAHVIRELVDRASETESVLNRAEIAQVMSIAGIARDLNPLLGGAPVSENPDLYLVQAFLHSHNPPAAIREKPVTSKTRSRKKSAGPARGK